MSYNTVGSFSFVSAVFLLAMGISDKVRNRPFFWGGLLLGIACYAYSTLTLVATAVAVVAGGLMWRTQRFRPALLASLAGSLIPVAGALVTVVYAGKENIQRILAFYHSMGIYSSPLTKLTYIGKDFLKYRVAGWVVLLLLASFIILPKLLGKRSWILLALLPTAGAFLVHRHVTGYELVVYPAVFGMFAFFLFRVKARYLPLEFAFFSFIGLGLTFAWTSTGVIDSAHNGAVPACFVLCVFLFERLHAQSKWVPLILGSAMALMLYNATDCYRHRFQDGYIHSMNVTIDHGAFAGIETNRATKAFLERIEEALVGPSKGEKTIAFFEDFPAGYLLSNLKKSAPSVWIMSNWVPYDQTFITNYYKSGARLPDVAIHVTSMPWLASEGSEVYRLPSRQHDKFLDMFRRAGYAQVFHDENFEILKLRRNW